MLCGVERILRSCGRCLVPTSSSLSCCTFRALPVRTFRALPVHTHPQKKKHKHYLLEIVREFAIGRAMKTEKIAQVLFSMKLQKRICDDCIIEQKTCLM
ncbi:hypothetical protein NMG60_11025372 [Bertholletia excelsa]